MSLFLTPNARSSVMSMGRCPRGAEAVWGPNPKDYDDIATNLQVVRERVAAAARAVGRDPAEVEPGSEQTPASIADRWKLPHGQRAFEKITSRKRRIQIAFG